MHVFVWNNELVPQTRSLMRPSRSRKNSRVNLGCNRFENSIAIHSKKFTLTLDNITPTWKLMMLPENFGSPQFHPLIQISSSLIVIAGECEWVKEWEKVSEKKSLQPCVLSILSMKSTNWNKTLSLSLFLSLSHTHTRGVRGNSGSVTKKKKI